LIIPSSFLMAASLDHCSSTQFWVTKLLSNNQQVFSRSPRISNNLQHPSCCFSFNSFRMNCFLCINSVISLGGRPFSSSSFSCYCFQYPLLGVAEAVLWCWSALSLELLPSRHIALLTGVLAELKREHQMVCGPISCSDLVIQWCSIMDCPLTWASKHKVGGWGVLGV
jgi:hypothetical protein